MFKMTAESTIFVKGHRFKFFLELCGVIKCSNKSRALRTLQHVLSKDFAEFQFSLLHETLREVALDLKLVTGLWVQPPVTRSEHPRKPQWTTLGW